ncbi:hypothetical protein DPMN_036207, partial [Dreissena polymorpha]
LHWKASIMGPENSPYEGGQFYLRIDFTVDYPLKPPKVWFLTEVYHPNVDSKGKICVDFLQHEWKPSFSISYILHWKASIMGPEHSPYEGGQFYLRIDFTADYPLEPPKVWFLTEVYHPNVDSKGKICVDFLQHEWKPSFSISYILLAICSLLALPNAENPVVQEIADVYLHDKPTFDKIAVEMTLEHAKPDF